MRKSIRIAVSGALCGAVLATALPTEVLAGPMGAAPPSTVGLSAPVDKVWYRRGYHHGGYYRRGYNPGAALAAGAAVGLLGAGLAAATSNSYYGGYYPYYGGYAYPAYGYGYAYPAYNAWDPFGGWGW